MKNDRDELILSDRSDEDLFEETAQRWVMLTEVVCRVMMLYGYPPCLLCSFVQYCTVCAVYRAAKEKQ